MNFTNFRPTKIYLQTNTVTPTQCILGRNGYCISMMVLTSKINTAVQCLISIMA
jgi:hypothetical protein